MNGVQLELPGTSVAAHRASESFTSRHRAIALAALASIGQGTFYDIADASELTAQQVWRRMNELERLGLATPTGATRTGPTGRQCRVWRAV